MHNLKELKIWTKAIDLSVKVYEATANFPKEEIYGLTSHHRKSFNTSYFQLKLSI